MRVCLKATCSPPDALPPTLLIRKDKIEYICGLNLAGIYTVKISQKCRGVNNNTYIAYNFLLAY